MRLWAMQTSKRTLPVSVGIAFACLVLSACGSGDSAPAPNPAPSTPAPSGLSYPAVPALTVAVAMAPVSPTVTGQVSSYTVAPALPAGLTLNSTSGVIGGTPSAITATNSYVVNATNSGGSTTFSLTLIVNGAGEFRLEPAAGTTIGVGQAIDVFASYKVARSDPFPLYLDPASVTFESSQPSVAAVSNTALLRGVSAGTTTISASYQGYRAQLTVTVAGSYVERSLSVAGQGVRRYSLYVPPGAATRPLLITMHGGGGSARNAASSTLLSKLGAEQNVLVAYPEGSGVIQTFNAGVCCGSARTLNIDDVSFVAAVIDDIRANYTVDAARVYATGFSNGGMMSHRLACAMADRIAGIVAVGGASGQFDRDGVSYYGCAPSRPVRVMQIHATNDRNYPYAGGFGDGLSDTNFYPVEATISDWRTRNNVTAQARVDNVTPTTTCFDYSTAADTSRPSAPVVLCRVNPVDLFDPSTGIVHGGGHSWPGGNRSLSPGSDVPVQDFNANSYMWRFLTL
jgi:polyhydroxybutyrate depolymerase